MIMRYLIRSIKYLLWFCVVFCAIMAILIATTEGQTFGTMFDPEIGMFRAGSFPKIVIFFIAMAAIYPSLAFSKKDLVLYGSFKDNEALIRKQFEVSGYEVVSETNEEVVYRLKSPFIRFMRMFEDHITITKVSPVKISGMRKDALRLASAIEFQSRKRVEE